MAYRIGFTAEYDRENEAAEGTERPARLNPRRSVVRVQFQSRGGELAYYNDQFDLKAGDIVYVDGKYTGQQGRVIGVNYTFKIKLSDYKRVIAVVDTAVHGQFFAVGSHFVTFDRAALPKEKALLWFKAPEDPEAYVSGSDGSSFPLDDLSQMDVSETIALRGRQYYVEDRVRYLSVDGMQGYAIVQGSEVYEVEFTYRDGKIGDLTCTCPCAYRCKHSFAAMLQLHEMLERIGQQGRADAGYFATIEAAALLRFAVAGRQRQSITL